MLFDIHTHTALSPCSAIPVKDMVSGAKNRGLDGICITDHDTMRVNRHLTEGVQENGIVVIFGMEYETPEGDFLIFGPFEDIDIGLDAPTLLTRVIRQGGVAVAAHPFRPARPVADHLLHTGLIRVVESFNGRNRDIDNLKVQKWRKTFSFNEVGGSDAHTLEELGAYTTRLTIPVHSRQEFIHALTHGYSAPEKGVLPSAYSAESLALNC